MLKILLLILAFSIYLSLVGCVVWLWKEFFYDYDFVILIFAVIMTIVVLIPFAVTADIYKKESATQIESLVEVTVIDKRYSSPTTMMVKSGSVFVPITTSASYNVKVTDGEYDKNIDNEDLYNQLDIGDKFTMQRVLYEGKDGKVFSHKFNLVE